MIGTRLKERYRIESELGRGGMGAVYRTSDTQTGEIVAVKALNPEVLARDPGMLERFIREGEALRRLNHPNIVRMIAAVEDHGQHYLVMEFVEGGSLHALLASRKNLPASEVIRIALEVSDALSRAHHLGIIHRDLKPANVLIAKDGTPRLADFGIAHLENDQHLTQTGVLVGTVDYVSPEVCQGERPDERNDIWAFGVMLFEMLSGRLPFVGSTLTARLTAILTQPVPNLAQLAPDVPPALINLVNRMLQKDPQQRIPSVRLIGAELEAMLKGRAPLTPAPAGPAARNNLPSGTVTFLFSDIEGSTKMAREYPETWETTRARHNALLQKAMDDNHGHVFQIIGDAFCVAFHNASDALQATAQAQNSLFVENWGVQPVKSRMGLHTGKAEIQPDGQYIGYAALSHIQRVMSCAHGGQTLLSQAAQEMVRDDLPESMRLRDLKEHRLKDILQPEHLYQLEIPGLPQDFPAMQSRSETPNNLPINLSKFIGREKEVAEVKQALSEYRLVTLTGSGGVGKTRLSLQVATELLTQFSNGTWFVELAPVTDPALIPQTILTAAEMQAQPGRSAFDSLSDFLREKTALLVLDNCEHLIEACARLADTLLNIAPNLKILASSREALGVKGEQAWHVPSLSVPDLKHLPATEGLSQYEAVRLFIDRALLAQPHFAVTDENARAVAQICARLDGIPLAIELAAARVKVLKAEQIADRLNDRFRLLTGGSRTALPRQQTLRALIDWSYDLLADNEKLLLRRLAVFMGGWTLEAAEQVGSDGQIQAEEVLDLLIHLVDKSLVVVDEQPGQLRYRMLETVRQYVREKLLELGESEKLHTQHLAYFLEFAEEAEPHLSRAEQIEWLNRLELDDDNLRAALDWAVDDPYNHHPEAALRLCNALWFFWFVRGYRSYGQECLERALSKPGQPRVTMARGRALGYFTFLALMVGTDSQELELLLEESLEIGNAMRDRLGVAFALYVKGRSAWIANNTAAAKTFLSESLNVYREINNQWGLARVLFTFGQIHDFFESDYPTARRYYEESLQIYREIGERRGMSVAVNNFGNLAMNQGDWEGARSLFEQSLSMSRELGDKNGICIGMTGISMTLLAQGIDHFSEKSLEELLAEILSIERELGDKGAIAETLVDIGRVARFQNNYAEALKLHTENLTYAREINNKWLIAQILLPLGELARLENNYAAAHSYLLEALSLEKEINDRRAIVCSFEEFAALGAAQGQAKRSAILFGAAETLRTAIHVVLLPIERVEVEKNIAAARAQLDETTFNAAWAEGRAMSMEQAIEFALQGTDQ